MDVVLKFRMLVLQSLHGLSLEATERMVRDRLGSLGIADTVPDSARLTARPAKSAPPERRMGRKARQRAVRARRATSGRHHLGRTTRFRKCPAYKAIRKTVTPSMFAERSPLE
jgi:hypothetical protein